MLHEDVKIGCNLGMVRPVVTKFGISFKTSSDTYYTGH